MKKIQTSFRIDDRLKTLFDAYCDDRGLVKERALEALVFGVVVQGNPSAEQVFQQIQDLIDWDGKIRALEVDVFGKSGVLPKSATPGVQAAAERIEAAEALKRTVAKKDAQSNNQDKPGQGSVRADRA